MKKWEILNDKKIVSKDQINDLVDVLLKNRGINNKKEKDDFFDSDLSKITFKDLGINQKDLSISLKRIKKAIDYKEQVVVFGDYDVDGITASAIIWETLNSLGANIMPYIPNRISEGYGLSKFGIDNALVKYPETKLIITVDNGIVANSAVDYANEKGIDVIVTDHHVSTENLPKALSIIHSTKVCGASVAYFFSRFLEEKLHGKTNKNKHLDLVAIATVADVMELKEFNRKLLMNALPFLRKTKRVGLQKLFEISGIDSEKIGIYEIGHVIAPRLNATGRMGDATDSLRLICTKDEKRAKELAKILNEINLQRQNSTFKSFEDAKAKVNIKNKIIITYSEDFEPGIIGLISGKLTEEYYKPSIVLSIGKEKSKASARSISGFNIIDFIRLHQEYLLDAGGHPMAAGFTIETEKIVAFEKAILKLSQEKIIDEILIRKLKIDLEISLNVINQDLYDEIQKISPFGYGNPEPCFLTTGLTVDDLRKVGKEGKHMKVNLKDSEGNTISGILFSYDNSLNIKIGSEINAVYSLSLNDWGGNKKIEMKIKDLKIN